MNITATTANIQGNF